MAAEREVARRARDDVEFFARALVGQELWPHQAEVVRSPARYRVVCAGRQVGKSRLLAIMALHDAFRAPDRLVLLVSAGEVAARRLLDEVVGLASSPLLAGAVVDESKSQVVLSNGSRILAVPASARQIRGWSVDLLIVDEAGFVDDDTWRAAEPSIIARPGSRVVLSSSPWGASGHFFRRFWTLGMASPDAEVASWHWPTSVSPMVDEAQLEQIRLRESPTYFAREFLAEWTDGAGSYFTTAEVDEAVADYELIDLNRARNQLVAGGVDWGFASDANVLALVGVAADGDLNRARFPTEPVFFLAHLSERFRLPYGDFVEEVVSTLEVFDVKCLASEQNGVGAAPTEMLRRLAWERHTRTHVAPVWTDARRKMSMFGTLKLLLQQGRLVLPRHPGLLRQMAALEFEITDAGSMRIAVPERAGHDDLVMALGQAMSCVRHSLGYRPEPAYGVGEPVFTAQGTGIYERPRCVWFPRAFQAPKGSETGEGW